VGAGYVLRRLIRRAVRHGRKLAGDHAQKAFLSPISAVVIERSKGPYPELEQNRASILAELDKEEAKFMETLQKG
jgi:alanyl-tRNA synthetase